MVCVCTRYRNGSFEIARHLWLQTILLPLFVSGDDFGLLVFDWMAPQVLTSVLLELFSYAVFNFFRHETTFY